MNLKALSAISRNGGKLRHGKNGGKCLIGELSKTERSKIAEYEEIPGKIRCYVSPDNIPRKS